jgi:hypothetical protein
MKRIVALSLFLSALFAGQAVLAEGFYLEFKIVVGDNRGSGNMKTYAQDGNTRSEIELNMSMGGPEANPTAGPTTKIVSLTLKDKPEKAYMLSEDKKTYSEMDISKDGPLKDSPDDYEVTVVGKEKVNGYNSTHVKVKVKSNGMEQEMWTSTDITGYAEYQKIKTKYTGKEGLNKALAVKGAEGFPVRIKIAQGMMSAQIDLVEAKRKDNPASMFSLEGYTKAAGGTGTGGQNVQDMVNKMKNMSPEERQKFLEQMKQQHQGGN